MTTGLKVTCLFVILSRGPTWKTVNMPGSLRVKSKLVCNNSVRGIEDGKLVALILMKLKNIISYGRQ